MFVQRGPPAEVGEDVALFDATLHDGRMPMYSVPPSAGMSGQGMWTVCTPLHALSVATNVPCPIAVGWDDRTTTSHGATPP